MVFLASENPLGHVVDVTLIPIAGGSGPFTTLLSMHMVTFAFVCVLVVVALLSVARSMQRGQASDGVGRYLTKGIFAQAIEAICVHLRDEIVKPQLGEATDRFIGFLWTVFFFILFANLFGLLPVLDIEHLLGVHTTPIGGAVTANIAITSALAVIAFAVFQINGIRSLGVKEYLKEYTAGAPAYMWALMIPIEIVGTFVKPFALSVRLFANMVSGHALIASLMMFTSLGLNGLGWWLGGGISALAILSALPLMALELLVAFIQAFIFMILTTVFIAQLMPHEHGHDDESADADAVGANTETSALAG